MNYANGEILAIVDSTQSTECIYDDCPGKEYTNLIIKSIIPKNLYLKREDSDVIKTLNYIFEKVGHASFNYHLFGENIAERGHDWIFYAPHYLRDLEILLFKNILRKVGKFEIAISSNFTKNDKNDLNCVEEIPYGSGDLGSYLDYHKSTM